MILATNDDVQDRLRRELTGYELGDVTVLLEEASLLVEGYLRNRGVVFDEDDDDLVIPREVAICVSRIVARALTANPDIVEGTDRVAMGPFQAQLSDPYSTSVYLGRSDCRWLAGVVPTAVSVPLQSERGGFDCDA